MSREAATVKFATGGARPTVPLAAAPGTGDKVAGMFRRAQLKLAIFHPGDDKGWAPESRPDPMPLMQAGRLLPDQPTFKDIWLARVRHASS